MPRSIAPFIRSLSHTRQRLLWIAVAAMPLIAAACNKSGGGAGY